MSRVFACLSIEHLVRNVIDTPHIDESLISLYRYVTDTYFSVIDTYNVALFRLEAPEFAFLLLTIRRRLVFSAILPSCLAELSLSTWSDHRACAVEASIATEMADANVDIAEFDRKKKDSSYRYVSNIAKLLINNRIAKDCLPMTFLLFSLPLTQLTAQLF